MKTGLNKIAMLIIAVMFYTLISVAVAGDGENELGISMDVTWVSKYIWRGQDVYDDHAAFQPSIDFDLFGTGFSANFWASYAGSSGYRDIEEFNYSIAYSSTAFDGEKVQTDFILSWWYFDLYDAPTRDNDSHEFLLDLSWPQISSFGMIPCYTLSYLTPASGGGTASDTGGFAHIFGFSYDVQLPQLKEALTFSWDITYNDGQGSDFDHDWSHMTWAVSASFDDVLGATLKPALYYQTSMERSVNEEDEFWIGISYGFDF